MKETIVHGWGKLAHSPELAGSWFSRLPKLVAALLVAGTSSRAAQATKGASLFIRLLLEIANPRRSSHRIRAVCKSTVAGIGSPDGPTRTRPGSGAVMKRLKDGGARLALVGAIGIVSLL